MTLNFALETAKAMDNVDKEKISSITTRVQKVNKQIELEKDKSYLTASTIPKGIPSTKIPDELLIHVFSFLKIDDLGRVAQVSSVWRRICGFPELWRKMSLKSYRNYLSTEDLMENPQQKVIHRYSVNVKIKKLRRQRDGLIKQAISESKIETAPNPYHRYGGYYMGGKECVSSIGRNPTMKHPVSNKFHLLSAREVNECLILLGDVDAIERKKRELKEKEVIGSEPHIYDWVDPRQPPNGIQ